MKSEIIFYARVSTRRQGKSGLGLSAQRKAVQAFADAEAFQNRQRTSRWKPARRGPIS
jgi:DNA invertase Pin-like site-specific DNA recombinase